MTSPNPHTPTPTHLLTHRIDVQRLTVTQDAAGSPVRSYAAHLSNIKARVQPLKLSEARAYGADLQRPGYRIHLGDHDVIATDRVQFADAAGVSHTLEVKEALAADSHRNLLRLIAVTIA